MVQSLIHSRLSLSGILLLWCLKNPYFESQIPNRSKCPTITAVPQWYLGALVAQKPVLRIGNPQWFKVSYFQGLASLVCGCFGGSKTRTLNDQFPMVQSLILYFRVLHRLCPNLHCNAAQLVREGKIKFPLFNRDITNTRLLVDVYCFLLRLASGKMQLCSHPLASLSLFFFADPMVFVHRGGGM